MNPDTVVIGPEENFTSPLPLSGVAVVLTKALDNLFMETVRPLSLESDPATRAELFKISLAILEGGKQNATPRPATCLLLEGEVRVMTGLLKALVKEESQPARSVLFELLVLLMGNGWRRGNHIGAGRCTGMQNQQNCCEACGHPVQHTEESA